MAHLIKRIILFFALPALFVLATEFQLYYLGESLPIEVVFQRQREDPNVHFMRGILSQDYNVYKYLGIREFESEILVIGSSRVMKFRQLLFSEEFTFYNAGGIAQSAHDVIQLAENFKRGDIQLPKVLIVGLDPWWFKLDYEPKTSWLIGEQMTDHAYDFEGRPSIYYFYYRSLLADRFKVNDADNLGIYARHRGAGFRLNGSKSIEPNVVKEYLKNPGFIDREIPPIDVRIEEGLTNKFTFSQPDSLLMKKTVESLVALDELIEEIVVYLPPFSAESYQLLGNSLNHQEWWNSYNRYFYHQLLSKFDCVIPAESPLDYDLPDDYFIDGIHPSEVFVAKQMLNYSTKNGILGLIINEELRDDLFSAQTPLSFDL